MAKTPNPPATAERPAATARDGGSAEREAVPTGTNAGAVIPPPVDVPRVTYTTIEGITTTVREDGSAVNAGAVLLPVINPPAEKAAAVVQPTEEKE